MQSERNLLHVHIFHLTLREMHHMGESQKWVCQESIQTEKKLGKIDVDSSGRLRSLGKAYTSLFHRK